MEIAYIPFAQESIFETCIALRGSADVKAHPNIERIAESAINTDLQTPQATATRRPRLRCHLH